MIQIIEKQLELLNVELENDPKNKKVCDLIKVLELFKEVFSSVLGQNKEGENTSALGNFIIQYLIGNGNVNFKGLVGEFMELHKLSQSSVFRSTGVGQGRISEFLKGVHAMQSDNMEKIFSVIDKKEI